MNYSKKKYFRDNSFVKLKKILQRKLAKPKLVKKREMIN